MGIGEALPLPVSEIRTIHVRRFLAQISAGGVKPGTILHYINELGAFFKYAVTEGFIVENPVNGIKRPRVPEKPPEYLSVDELVKLFSSVDLSDKYGLRNLVMMKTLYYAGLRDGELVMLKLGDIKDNFGYLEVRHAKGDKDRLVPIHRHLKQVLIRYIEKYQIRGEDSYLFQSDHGRKLTRHWVSILLSRYSAKSGLDKKFRAHTLRHTFATHLYQMDVDLNTISELIGHSSLDSTAIYTHTSLKRLEGIMKKL